jgi:hypothetical protein
MEESDSPIEKLKAALHRPMVFRTPVILTKRPEWMSQESFDLHNRIQERSIKAIAGVKEMLKHPYTLEQAFRQQEERNK